MAEASTSQRLGAEFVGTLLLLAAVVGSGIMGNRLAGGNAAIALLANTLATGAALYALIAALAPVSGAHFNPLVSIFAALHGRLAPTMAMAYVAVQITAACLGVACAHAMYGEEVFQKALRVRNSIGEVFAELVATFGLLVVIELASRRNANATPLAVAAYITSAYWFTSSTSFANPAATLARATTNTFASIRLADVPAFLLAQVVGAVLAFVVSRSLLREAKDQTQ